MYNISMVFELHSALGFSGAGTKCWLIVDAGRLSRAHLICSARKPES